MIERSLFAVACIAVATAGCYPDRSVGSTTAFASVTTLFDEEATFSGITRYALPDTVMYIPRGDDEVPAATQTAILSTLRQQLNGLGWTEVTDARSTPVDVYVTTAITSQTNVFYTYIWWDYWYWYGYWPVGWGASTNWYYPGYWYPYSYTTGTVLVGVIDARTAPAGNEDRVPLIWTAGVNGVLADGATNLSIAVEGLEQAFAQSPYLRGQ